MAGARVVRVCSLAEAGTAISVEDVRSGSARHAVGSPRWKLNNVQRFA